VRKLRLRCPAKLNLHLEVLGRRPDGYHELRTVYQTIALCDDLEVEESADGFRLAVAGDDSVPAGEGNLVLRAARALSDAFPGGIPGARFRLRKRIPAEAGLGGGSSDAAAALAALATLYRIPRGALRGVAASVGSDVPLFLFGGTLLGTGRGERIRRLGDLPRLGVVLLVPSWPCPTRQVFAALPPLTPPRGRPKIRPLLRNLAAGRPARLRNDLEAAVLGLGHDLGALRAFLEETGALAVGMSGSGSTAFGLYPDLRTARARVRRTGVRGTRLLVTEFLERDVPGTAFAPA